MIDLKRGQYWMEHVKMHRNPAELWRVIDEGTCRTREHFSGLPPGPSADDLADYFEEKVADIRAASSDAPPPEFLDIQTRLHCFAPVTVDGVRVLINASNNKYSSLDPMPTWLLKSCSDLLAPAVVRIFNSSLQSGVFPSCFSKVLIAPRVKKQSLPHDNPSRDRMVIPQRFLLPPCHVRLPSYP